MLTDVARNYFHVYSARVRRSAVSTLCLDAVTLTPRGLLGKYPRRGADDDDKYETRCLRLNNNEMTSLAGFSDLLSSLLVQPDALSWLDLSFNKLPNIDPVCTAHTLYSCDLEGKGARGSCLHDSPH